ncbi:MAG: hypothetical protein AAFV59_15645 [Pseudomonadota bacterium]
MAAPKMQDAWSRRAVLAGFTAASLVAAAPAGAQDNKARPVATYQQELDQLEAATRGAHEYATNNFGVGIVLHVGRDISGRPDADAALAQVERYLINEFAKRGVEARVFPRSNSDTVASGVAYHIDQYIHGANNGTALKDLQTALDSIPDVIALLRAAKGLALNQSEPGTPGGG